MTTPAIVITLDKIYKKSATLTMEIRLEDSMAKFTRTIFVGDTLTIVDNSSSDDPDIKRMPLND